MSVNYKQMLETIRSGTPAMINKLGLDVAEKYNGYGFTYKDEIIARNMLAATGFYQVPIDPRPQWAQELSKCHYGSSKMNTET